MSTQAKPFINPEEYLEVERAAEYKSQYYQGEMFAMAGASEPHNMLAANVLMAIGLQLRSRQFRAYGSDMRVRASATDYIHIRTQWLSADGPNSPMTTSILW